jgi:hypothetical protein
MDLLLKIMDTLLFKKNSNSFCSRMGVIRTMKAPEMFPQIPTKTGVGRSKTRLP